MLLKEPKAIIRNLFKKYVKVDGNLIHAEKFFIINAVIGTVFSGKSYTEINKKELLYYGEIITKYLNGELDIHLEDGKVIVEEVDTGSPKGV
jgi:hypothetical protein